MLGEAAAPPALGMSLLRGSNVKRMVPSRASAAWNFPLPSPKKTTSPPIARPDFAGRDTSIFQTILPVVVSVAPNNPKGCERGTRLVKVDPRWSPLGRGSLFPSKVLNVVGSYLVP